MSPWPLFFILRKDDHFLALSDHFRKDLAENHPTVCKPDASDVISSGLYDHLPKAYLLPQTSIPDFFKAACALLPEVVLQKIRCILLLLESLPQSQPLTGIPAFAGPDINVLISAEK